MNTYHFVNNPVAKSDMNRLIKKLEQVIVGSFARQVKKHAENDNSVVIINHFVGTKERIS